MTIRAAIRRPLAALALLAALASAGAASAADPYPYDGMRVLESAKSYPALVAAFNEAVEAEPRVFVVTRASATVGVRNRFGEEIPGNMVAGVYGPEFAKRMLEASIPAGIEAPIRFYLTEDPQTGKASLTYRTPSAVFAPYAQGPGAAPGAADLAAMAQELDAIFARIAGRATAAE
ncbi:MAG: DUF302 domain-containing protein [Alphaproteobacteria bacterium]|nr:DUF302 domain-containing protein [Alphaproteobacteria bacterium]